MKTNLTATLLVLALANVSNSEVITFGDEQQFSLEFVEIGDPGNRPDEVATLGDIGAVPYEYNIAKFEVSREIVQYAVSAGVGIGISDTTVDGIPLEPEMPISNISWHEVTRFINWLNTSHGYPVAYDRSNFDHIDPSSASRNNLARFVLPSPDEAHKAGHYDPDANDGAGGYWRYATGSNEPPVAVASGTDAGSAVWMNQGEPLPAPITEAGGLSPYGVMGLSGNVAEFEDVRRAGMNEFLPFEVGVRVGSWRGNRITLLPEDRFFLPNHIRSFDVGFRVVDLGEIPAGDFNGDRVFTPHDIDELVDAINSPEPSDLYDLNGDGSVNADDRTFWIEELANVTYGDADMNGEVDFGDFLALSGAFETDGGWSGGDFDGSGLTDFDDFLTLSGNFGEPTVVASVPEPRGLAIVGAIALSSTGWRRRKR